jgi:hypothetical protein
VTAGVGLPDQMEHGQAPTVNDHESGAIALPRVSLGAMVAV